jgi:hypothetical protein
MLYAEICPKIRRHFMPFPINETMFGSGYENCPEFGVLGGVIFKLDIL